MGIPDSILAAGIGGAATIMAALFQLYTALRVKTKADSRPKKANLWRSSLAIAALMIASAAGGYLFAGLRQQQAIDDARAMREELRSMRDEINAELQALKQTAQRPAREHAFDDQPADVETLVLARGATDRACDESSSDGPSTCEAARAVAPETPAGEPPTEGGAL